MDYVKGGQDWVKGAWSNFFEAMKTKDVLTAKDIIADVLECDFIDDARAMNIAMRNLLAEEVITF